jgi:hypothetical protein
VKFNHSTFVLYILTMPVLFSCGYSGSGESKTSKISEEFAGYWNAGKAEINSYKLVQNRYGEERLGNAILIFVTEDFSINKQVKLDEPEYVGSDKVNVLKLNMTKNFITGIYPYSMMLSVFTPVDEGKVPRTLKASMSAQEWCGQVYTQVNLRHRGYEIASHSYFESEGDENHNLRLTLLEDEIWNRIRTNHHGLPIGETEIIPGLFFSRLNHTGYRVEKAICSKQEVGDIIHYAIQYPSQNRTLMISYEKAFPHKIIAWQEEVDVNGKLQTTLATWHKQLHIDYWSKNKNEFLYLRDSLGLSHQNY